MSNFVRVKEGFGKIEDSRTERFSRAFFVKGASFEGWYDEREIEGNTSVEDQDMELTYVEDDEIEEEEAPKQSSLFTEEFVPFGTVSAAEFDPYLAQDDEEIDNPAPEVLPDPEEAPVVEFDEAAEPAEDDEAKTAAWRDVQRKAKRLRDTGSITVEYVDELMITGQVQGDNGTYATAVYRGGRDLTDRQLSTYKCSCKWGNWVYRRGKYFGRLCSHSLAMFYEMQASDRKRRRSSSLERKATASDRWPEILEIVRIHNDSGDYWGRDEEFWEPIADFADEIGLTSSDVIEIAESTLGIEASTSPRVKKEAKTVYACPECDEPVVESYGGWRDCPNCGWKETHPVDLKEYAGDFEDDFDYWASTDKESSVKKGSVAGREAFYGGTTVIIRDILSNNRVAVSYPEDDSWFVVMDEDLYSQDSSAPWGVEASYVEERISGENPGLEYADALVGSEGMHAYAADEEEDDSDEDDNGDTASDSGDSVDSGDDSSSGDSAEEEQGLDYEEDGEDEDAKTARMARQFLKEAGKSYSLEEQQALIDEDGISHDAINSLKLEGTHYINDELILP